MGACHLYSRFRGRAQAGGYNRSKPPSRYLHQMSFVRASSLTAKLSQQFAPDVRQRGQAYYLRRHVRIRHGSDAEVDASVSGAREYDVMMSLEGRRFRMWCDCEYFESDGPCKHLWATV